MKTKVIVISILSIILLVSCSHTNELAKYQVNGKKFVFNEYVSAKARVIEIDIKNYGNDKDEKKKEDKDADNVLDILTSIGTEILSAEKINKLENSVNTDEQVAYVGRAMKKAMKTYLNIEEVPSLENNPLFVCDVLLNECKLVISKYEVAVSANVTSTIIERSSGEIVWENTEYGKVPIKSNYGVKNKTSKKEEKILNVIQLATLDEEELNRVVGAAIDKIGYLFAETLREDVVEVNKNN